MGACSGKSSNIPSSPARAPLERNSDGEDGVLPPVAKCVDSEKGKVDTLAQVAVAPSQSKSPPSRINKEKIEPPSVSPVLPPVCEPGVKTASALSATTASFATLNGKMDENTKKLMESGIPEQQREKVSSITTALEPVLSNNATQPGEENKQRTSLPNVPVTDGNKTPLNLEESPKVPSEMRKVTLVERDPITLENGIVYKGQWCGDKKHGYGKQVWPDGAHFEGQWRNGVASGDGTFVAVDGDRYVGQWENDKSNGYGEFIRHDGSWYKGNWKDDKKHGSATEVWPDGSRFEGIYVDGMKEGEGVIQWAEKSTYRGEFRNNEIDGKGRYEWADGRVYEGNWKSNKMMGFGSFTWTDGRQYIGNYVDDLKEGYGKIIWVDGRVYEGEWKGGKQHGNGIFTGHTGQKRAGIWLEGKRVRWAKGDEERTLMEALNQCPREIATSEFLLILFIDFS
ncbi:membrane occupation and recognition nexus protein MORN2 [Cardiosporidium cionae]|uniref:Membrane occupation and recognition nexus protein MORN2 n=1 Tax=Cardiosporidium cionae TaxID=476202 RepID=A0ABQ7JD92_9APIC|nr:membrane occupation and recognition nexus protein MORN2 [Cardiosporidium cionae]|eukprot:KAF8821929.1 membrane occupation and recognition nexus protein MORN2 [Cardiosporidium cionae]